MIPYLLKSAVCLLATLLFYKLVLERQKQLRFNRFFLLGSLVFSAVAPLLAFELPTDELPFSPAPFLDRVEQDLVKPALPIPQSTEPTGNAPNYVLWLYGFVTTLLLIRFGRNVYFLLRLARLHPTSSLNGATLVLLPTDVLPHTFGHYLFVSRSAYENHAIEPELFTHELAHIHQRHTLDILFVELLLTIAWFNPLLYLFKRAIQLNHEFLADRAVTVRHQSIAHYQRLLLSKLTPGPSLALTSTLTFQTTKQRFVMMTKHTSRFAGLLATGCSVLLFAALLFAFGTQTIAQVAPAAPTKPQTTTAQPGKPRGGRVPQLTVAEMEQRFTDKLVHMPMENRKPVYKKFNELTSEQKKHVVYIAPEERMTPNEAEFERWKNPKIFGMWVDGKRVRNFANTKLKASDIVAYSGSYVHKNARQPEGYLYQMDVMTAPYYKKYLKECEESPFLSYIERYTAK